MSTEASNTQTERSHNMTDTATATATQVKRCAKCEETKPVGDFYVNHMNLDGLYEWCSTCVEASKISRSIVHIEHRNITTAEGEVECKLCNNCERWQPVDHFNSNRGTWDRLSVWCKDCTSEYNRKQRRAKVAAATIEALNGAK